MKKQTNNTILTKNDLKLFRYKVLYAVILLIMLIMVLVTTLPVIWIMLSGFKDPKELFAIPPTFLPKKIDFGKVADAWNGMKFYKYYINTFIMAGGSVIANILICGLAGYSFSKVKPKGSNLIFMIFFWIMLLPSTVRTVPQYMIIKDFPIFHFNMTNTFLPMWLMQGADIFKIILFKNFFDTISNSIFEAGKVDGANELKIFFKIIMPISVPIFIVSGLLCFNSQLGQFFWPYLTITDPNKTVLGVQIFKMKKSTYTMDYQMLALMFAMLPQLIIFAIFQKHIIGGINLGGVKG